MDKDNSPPPIPRQVSQPAKEIDGIHTWPRPSERKYYTLAPIPSFDADGLWAHSGVLFSSRGTLRKTIVYLVNKAAAGHTHAELQERLQLRMYDTLHDLVTAREIARAEMEQLYLYVSTEPERAEAQMAARQRLIPEQPRPGPLPDAVVVIEVLLAVLSQAGYCGGCSADASARASDLQILSMAMTSCS